MRRAATFAIVACLLALPPPAAAQVHRCLMPDGKVVYTDRSCSSLGAIQQSRKSIGSVYSPRLHYGRCAATLPDLVYELTSAIDTADVNRLAAAYHWPGLGGRVANATMDRLDAIASRPLLDVRVIPGPDPLAPPASLRVEQVMPATDQPLTTTLYLHRHLGCWWVRL